MRKYALKNTKSCISGFEPWCSLQRVFCRSARGEMRGKGYDLCQETESCLSTAQPWCSPLTKCPLKRNQETTLVERQQAHVPSRVLTQLSYHRELYKQHGSTATILKMYLGKPIKIWLASMGQSACLVFVVTTLPFKHLGSVKLFLKPIHFYL